MVRFLWDGDETVSTYSQPGARIRNIGHNPKVTLNVRGDPKGDDIVVLAGTAEVDESAPSAAENAAWLVKYAAEWEHAGMTGESFSLPQPRPGVRHRPAPDPIGGRGLLEGV